MKIVKSDVIKIDAIPVDEIELFLSKSYDDIIRWAITNICEGAYDISISYIEKAI